MKTCPSCHHSYDGADGALRCRIHSNGLKCSPELANDCAKFVYAPGTDAEESPWFTGGWCLDQGRGD